MPPFTVNPQRFGPNKNYRFRLKWDGRYVAGNSKISALKRTTDVVEPRDGEVVELALAAPEAVEDRGCGVVAGSAFRNDDARFEGHLRSPIRYLIEG